MNCLHSNWTTHDCHHHEDAGVACTSECLCVYVLYVYVCSTIFFLLLLARLYLIVKQWAGVLNGMKANAFISGKAQVPIF